MSKIKGILLVFSAIIFSQRFAQAQCCDFTWQQQVEPSTSSATFGVALADFDSDNDLDVAVVSAYDGIEVYFNDSTGTFTLNSHYVTSGDNDFYGIYAADIDNDTDLDIIAAPFYTSTNVTFLKNNGSGSFTVSDFGSNISVYNMATGDIDGDRDVDIFMPNAGGGSGKVLKNNGSGIYSLFQTVPGARGHDAALADLDGDGDLDAFVSENSSVGNAVFLNNGSGTFTNTNQTLGAAGGEVALGDLDGDGDADAWVGTASNISEIWINDSTGIFSLDTALATDASWGYCKSVKLADNDGDGDLDVFLGFYSNRPQVWKNEGNMNFALCYEAPVGSSSHGQDIGDINGDGKLDIYSGFFSNDDGDYVFLQLDVPSAAIAYSDSSYCTNAANQSAQLTGTAGGNFSSSPGLSIDSVTGEIAPAASAAGTYIITYSLTGACAPATTNITITEMPDASISYTGPFCSDTTLQTVKLTGTAGGTFSSTAGLSINTANGAINPATSAPGNYTVAYTIAAAGGCAAFSTTTGITVTHIDVSTSLSGDTISANAPADAYQWIDCSNSNAPLNGETNREFTATSNGNYAVIISQSGCADTSACTAITSVGMDDVFRNGGISIYPCPAEKWITVKASRSLSGSAYTITDGLGKTVLTGKLTAESTGIVTEALPAGVYVLRIETINKKLLVR